MPVRILQIIPSLDRAGAEKQLLLLAAHLPREEFEVHVCALTRGGPLAAELQAADVPVTVIGKRWKADPLAYWRLKRHIAALRPDLVHTWIFAANAYGRAAARAAGVRHLIASERCVDQWKAGYQFAIDRRLMRYTDRVVVNTSATRDFCVEHGLPAERFEVIPNGIPPARPSRFTRSELLAELGLPEDALLVGTVGRLWPQKGIKDLIWAFVITNTITPGAKLLVIGDGPQRSLLEQFVRDLKAEEYVLMLGHRDDVPDLMPHLDVYWAGSEYEGMPNAVMEAMAAGVPVVASDIPGHRDLVVPGETGMLYPRGDRASICRETDKLLADAALRRQLGEAAQQRMLEEFSVERMVERHVELYRQVLSAKGVPTGVTTK